MSRKKIVYWAPQDSNGVQPTNWNILYEDFQSVYDVLKNNKDDSNMASLFKCPSFINKTKNTFVFNNPLHTKIKIEHINNDSITGPTTNTLIIPLSNSYIESSIVHEPSIKNNILVEYGLYFYFFAEESLEMSICSPFFQKTDYLNYGAIVPGNFDIGSWFRKVNVEFNLWNGVSELELKEGEPLLYFCFPSNTNITFQRFSMTEKLYNISNTVASSSGWEPGVSLAKRYQRFKNSRTNELVLKEIKNNLL